MCSAAFLVYQHDWQTNLLELAVFLWSRGSYYICVMAPSRHVLRQQPCPGSNKPPVQASSGVSNIENFRAYPSSSAVISTQSASTQPECLQSIWSPSEKSLIKHIPKSARASCVSHLATLSPNSVSNPDAISN